MPNKRYLTQQGYDNFKKELEELIAKEPDLIKEVQRTAAMGDRSENAGYQNAKHMLRKTQGRIRYLERFLRNAEVVKKDTSGAVKLGSTVLLENQLNKGKEEYTLVDITEVNPNKGYISIQSPLGNLLLNKKPSDKVNLEINGHKLEYIIIKIH